MLVGRSDDLPDFLAALSLADLSLADFSDLVSDLAMRWLAALGVVGGVGRLLAAAVAGAGRLFVAVAATIGRTLYLIDLIERQGSFDPVTRRCEITVGEAFSVALWIGKAAGQIGNPHVRISVRMSTVSVFISAFKRAWQKTSKLWF
jgi:hypothetical protein